MTTERATPGSVRALDRITAEARACTRCAATLPLGPRPVFQLGAGARLLITSQAPGTRAHATATPFDDASGDRLRGWLGLTRAQCYDPAGVAIVPVGLCYPGRLPRGGDAPPSPGCAALWHPRLLPLLTGLRLTLLVGGHAQDFVLGKGRMAERVRDYAAFLPRHFPLPHPSWRTTGWERRNPWFAAELLPALRHAVAAALDRGQGARGGA